MGPGVQWAKQYKYAEQYGTYNPHTKPGYDEKAQQCFPTDFSAAPSDKAVCQKCNEEGDGSRNNTRNTE